MFDVDACPAVANALMLSAFTLCYDPFALLFDALLRPLVNVLSRDVISLRILHASYHHAINEYYEFGFEAILREM